MSDRQARAHTQPQDASYTHLLGATDASSQQFHGYLSGIRKRPGPTGPDDQTVHSSAVLQLLLLDQRGGLL